MSCFEQAIHVGVGREGVVVGVVGPTFNILKQIQLPVRYTDCGSWLWFELIKILQNILPFLEPILFTMSTT